MNHTRWPQIGLRPWSAGLLIGLAATFVGCTPSVTDKIVPVTGRITLDGQPLVGATVSFVPQVLLSGHGSSSVAVTDADGRFELELADTGKRGAYVGLHRVEVRLGEAEPEFSQSPSGNIEEVSIAVGPQNSGGDALPVCFNDESGIFLEIRADGPNHIPVELRELERQMR